MSRSSEVNRLLKKHGIDVYLSDVQRLAGAKMVTAISSDHKHFDSMIAISSRKVGVVAYSVVNRVIGMANRAEGV